MSYCCLQLYTPVKAFFFHICEKQKYSVLTYYCWLVLYAKTLAKTQAFVTYQSNSGGFLLPGKVTNGLISERKNIYCTDLLNEPCAVTILLLII